MNTHEEVHGVRGLEESWAGSFCLWSWSAPLSQDMNVFIDSVFQTPYFFFLNKGFIALTWSIINSTSNLSPFSSHGLIFLVTSPHLKACLENKTTPITKEHTRILGALSKEQGRETNVCLCYYITTRHWGTGIGLPHLQCLDSATLPLPSSFSLPTSMVTSSADLPPNTLTILLTSSLWALYSPSLPIPVVISCIYPTAFLLYMYLLPDLIVHDNTCCY